MSPKFNSSKVKSERRIFSWTKMLFVGHLSYSIEQRNLENVAIKKLNRTMVEDKQLYVGKFVKKTDLILSNSMAKYTNLYFKNLDTDISEEHLKEKFFRFRSISSLAISKDESGTSKGFEFVNFDDPDDARKAVEAMNGSPVDSKTLYVARAHKKVVREQLLKRFFE
ncbi:polyadenylate-binding protein 7-like [Capsicum annuum]